MPGLPLLLRVLYGAELLVTAPVIILLVLLALTLGVTSASAVLISFVETLFSWEKVSVQMTVFGALGLALSISGLVALCDFLSVSAVYLRHGASAVAPRRRLWRGLALSVLPLSFTMFVAVRSMPDDGSRMLATFYTSGAALLIPALHLGVLAWRGREGGGPKLGLEFQA